jgi:hypothetical protein
MKKDSSTSKSNDIDDLRPEYDLKKLKGGVKGKYLERYRQGTNLALLAPDVRKAFPTDEAVNKALRSVIESSRTNGTRRRVSRSK